MTVDWDKLRAPFAPNEIHWRIGTKTRDNTKALALAYIDARDVMARLDAVLGPEGWRDSYVHCDELYLCTLEIRIGDEWVAKSDGAGKTSIEAEKGGISDAFKRAAVKWGIGRHLYDIDSPWVPIEPMGKSWKITETGMEYLRSGAVGTPPVEQGPQKRGKKGEDKPPPQPPPAQGGTKTINDKQMRLLYKHANDRLRDLGVDTDEDGISAKDILDGLKAKAGWESIKEMPGTGQWVDRAVAYIDKWEPGQP